MVSRHRGGGSQLSLLLGMEKAVKYCYWRQTTIQQTSFGSPHSSDNALSDEQLRRLVLLTTAWFGSRTLTSQLLNLALRWQGRAGEDDQRSDEESDFAPSEDRQC